MDLRILKIASNTENNKIIDDFTHQSKNKNQINEILINFDKTLLHLLFQMLQICWIKIRLYC